MMQTFTRIKRQRKKLEKKDEIQKLRLSCNKCPEQDSRKKDKKVRSAQTSERAFPKLSF